MILCRHLPFSRRIAFLYVLAISVLFVLHFKIADDFTFNHVMDYSALRSRNENDRINRYSYSTPTHLQRGVQNSIWILHNMSNSATTSKIFRESDTRLKRASSTKESAGESNDTASGSFRHARSGDDTRRKPALLYTPPAGEAAQRRLPKAVIIGFTKCGTRALIEFLSLHPYIQVARNEVHYYDKDEHFDNGLDWYRQQMPLSYSNQITMEKTPCYVLSRRARDEMHRITPSARLIMLVRDPVVRLVSQFILRFRVINRRDHSPVTAIYRNNTGQFDSESRPVDIGKYHKHITMWLQRFPLRQMLVLNTEDLTREPLPVLKKVERFLKIPPLFNSYNVYFNTTSGFYCPRGFEPYAFPRCLGKSKGLAHPKLPPKDEVMLYRYYQPYNEKLFRLLGYKINWTEKEWGEQNLAKV